MIARGVGAVVAEAAHRAQRTTPTRLRTVARPCAQNVFGPTSQELGDRHTLLGGKHPEPPGLILGELGLHTNHSSKSSMMA